MTYICTECGLSADDYDDMGYPYIRECNLGGMCRFVTIEEYRQNQINNDRDDFRKEKNNEI